MLVPQFYKPKAKISKSNFKTLISSKNLLLP